MSDQLVGRANVWAEQVAGQMWDVCAGHHASLCGTLGVVRELRVVVEDEGAKEHSILSVDGNVATISIVGYLLDTVPAFLRWFGIDAVGYDEITEAADEVAADDTISRVKLFVDSPGGMVAGSKVASDALYHLRQRKHVVGIVPNLAASGGYRLVSQSTRILAGTDSITGSIGVYAVLVDSSEAAEGRGYKVRVVKSAPLKGTGVPGAEITDEQIAEEQKIVSGLAEHFVEEVARGREMPIEDVRKLATGGVWLGEESRNVGLIDAVVDRGGEGPGQYESVCWEGYEMTESQKTKQEQDEAARKADLEKAREEGQAEGTKLERARFKELRAAFQEEPAFVCEQFEGGADVAKAKAAFADVLSERLKKSEKELSELREKAGKGKDGPEETHLLDGEENSDSASASLEQRAKEIQKEQGGSYAEALKAAGHEAKSGDEG